jgi:hypothetical protein
MVRACAMPVGMARSGMARGATIKVPVMRPERPGSWWREPGTAMAITTGRHTSDWRRSRWREVERGKARVRESARRTVPREAMGGPYSDSCSYRNRPKVDVRWQRDCAASLATVARVEDETNIIPMESRIYHTFCGEIRRSRFPQTGQKNPKVEPNLRVV